MYCLKITLLFKLKLRILLHNFRIRKLKLKLIMFSSIDSKYLGNIEGRGVIREHLILLREGRGTIKMSIRSPLITYLSVGSIQQ